MLNLRHILSPLAGCLLACLAAALPARGAFEGLPLAPSNTTWASTRSIGVVSQLWEAVQERCLVLSDRVSPMSIVENWTIQVGYSNTYQTTTWVTVISPTNSITNSVVWTNKFAHLITFTTTNQVGDVMLTISNSAYAPWFMPLSTNSPTATTNVWLSLPVTHAFLAELDAKIFEMTPHFVNTNLAWGGSFDLWFSYDIAGSYPTNYPFLCKASVMEYANIGYRTNLVWSPYGYITGGDAWFTRQPALTNTWILWQSTREMIDICVTNGPANLNGNYIKADPADYGNPGPAYFSGNYDEFYLKEDKSAFIGRFYSTPEIYILAKDGWQCEMGPWPRVNHNNEYFTYQKLSTNVTFYFNIPWLGLYVQYEALCPLFSTNWVKFGDCSLWFDDMFPFINTFDPYSFGYEPPPPSTICTFAGTNGYWLNRNIANYDRRYYDNDPFPYWKRIYPNGLSSNELTNVVINIHAVGSKFQWGTPDSLGEQAGVPAFEDLTFTYSKTNIPSTNRWFRTFDTQSVVTGYAPIGTSIILMWTNSHFYDLQPYILYAENINERVKYIQQLVWTTHANYQWYGYQDSETPTISSRTTISQRWDGENYGERIYNWPSGYYKDPDYFEGHVYSMAWTYLGLTISGIYIGNLLPDEATWIDYQNAPPYENAHEKFELWNPWDDNTKYFIWHWMNDPVAWQVNPAIRWTDSLHITPSTTYASKKNIRPDIVVAIEQYLEINQHLAYRTPYGPYSPAWRMSLVDKSGIPSQLNLHFASLYPFFWELVSGDRYQYYNGMVPSGAFDPPWTMCEEWQTFSGEQNKTTLILTNIPTKKNWGQGINHEVNYYSRTNITGITVPFFLSQVSTINSNYTENAGSKEVLFSSITNMITDGRSLSSYYSDEREDFYSTAYPTNYTPIISIVSNAIVKYPEYTDYVVVTNYNEVYLWSLDPDDYDYEILEGITNVFYPTPMYGWNNTGTSWGLIEEQRIRTYSSYTNQLVNGWSTNGICTNSILRYPFPIGPDDYPYPVGVDGWIELYTNVVGPISITNITPAEILKVRYYSYTGPAGSWLDGTSPYPNTYLGTNSWISRISDLVLTNFAVTNVHTYYQTNLSAKLIHWETEYMQEDKLIATAHMKFWDYYQSQKFTTNLNAYLQYLDPLMKWDVVGGLRRK